MKKSFLTSFTGGLIQAANVALIATKVIAAGTGTAAAAMQSAGIAPPWWLILASAGAAAIAGQKAFSVNPNGTPASQPYIKGQ